MALNWVPLTLSWAGAGPAQCQRDPVQRHREDASRGNQAGHQLVPQTVCLGASFNQLFPDV